MFCSVSRKEAITDMLTSDACSVLRREESITNCVIDAWLVHRMEGTIGWQIDC